MEYLGYDIECIKYHTLVVFKRLDNTVYHEIWIDGIDSRISEHDRDVLDYIIENFTLIGYNNHHYDDVMLYAIHRECTQRAIKKCNDIIISNARKMTPHPNIKSLDVSQQIGTPTPRLKTIEGNMGKSIIESTISFDIDRPLTKEEKQEMVEYCRYDVESTIAIYKLRQRSYYETKDMLISMYGNDKAKKWNTTSIVAGILVPNIREYKRMSRLTVPDHIMENGTDIPEEVYKMWRNASTGYLIDPKGKKSVKHIVGDVEYVFASGGLHGATKGFTDVRDVTLLDVASMYPSIIVNLNALGNSTKLYDNIRKQRVSIKHTDPVKADAMKLILNSTYGLLKQEYSMLYNPLASLSVCVYGQLALYDLCERLTDMGYKVINANTDGVAFIGKGRDYTSMVKEWEEKYNLTLEADYFTRWIQKDVNNYLAVRDNGKIKYKGGDVKKVPTNFYFANNDIRIVQIALAEKLLNDKSVFNTIIEHRDEPLLYQYVLKAGRTYKGVYDSSGNKYQDVNRIFALNPKYDGITLYKKRQDDGLVSFPNTPHNMWVYNGDLDGLSINEFKQKIDINHYVTLANDKVDMWLNGR